MNIEERAIKGAPITAEGKRTLRALQCFVGPSDYRALDRAFLAAEDGVCELVASDGAQLLRLRGVRAPDLGLPVDFTGAGEICDLRTAIKGQVVVSAGDPEYHRPPRWYESVIPGDDEPTSPVASYLVDPARMERVSKALRILQVKQVYVSGAIREYYPIVFRAHTPDGIKALAVLMPMRG